MKALSAWLDEVSFDGRWFKYLLLPGYDHRERIGYTASEVAEATATAALRVSRRLDAWSSDVRNWGAR